MAPRKNYKTPVSEMEQIMHTRSQLQDFGPLIDINCSELSLIFVCLAHLPFCTNHSHIEPLLPCQSVCLHVYFNCIDHFNSVNLPWPQHLNCSNFPSPPLCVKPSSFNSSLTATSPTSPTSPTSEPHASSTIHPTSTTHPSATRPSSSLLPRGFFRSPAFFGILAGLILLVVLSCSFKVCFRRFRPPQAPVPDVIFDRTNAIRFEPPSARSSISSPPPSLPLPPPSLPAPTAPSTSSASSPPPPLPYKKKVYNRHYENTGSATLYAISDLTTFTTS